MQIVDTEKARKRLEATLAELDRSVTTLKPDSADANRQATPGDADAGLDLADNDRANALIEVANQQRSQVVEALQRITEGSYGRCVACGKPMSAGRLEAKPEASRCMQCQAQSESAMR